MSPGAELLRFFAKNREIAAKVHDRLAARAETADIALEHEKAAALYRKQAADYRVEAELC